MDTWRCELHSHQEDGVAVLTVAGRIGLDGAPLLAEELKRQIEGGASRVLVDLSAVDYVNSAGLRTLEAAARQLAAGGGGLALAGVREPVRLVLEMAGLSAIIAIDETRASAVLRLSHER
jgi:anti-anti-sigma factor